MNIAGKKVAYITLGCKLNFSETSTIRHSLEKEGTETVADKEGADIFVINTCSVTDMAEKKGRQLIRKIIHHNPGAYIIVVGCYAQLRAKEIMAIDGVSLVLGAGEKFNVAHYLQHLEEQEKQEPHSCDIFKISNFDLAYSFGDRTRCFLKIQDGCDYFCPRKKPECQSAADPRRSPRGGRQRDPGSDTHRCQYRRFRPGHGYEFLTTIATTRPPGRDCQVQDFFYRAQPADRRNH